MTRTLLATISALALTIAGAEVPAYAGPVQVPDHVELGRDGNGEACSADRTWADPGVTDPFAVSLAITCRGTTAGRHLGLARRVREADAEAFRKLIDCGDPKTFDLPGLGAVQARRCHDKVLGLPTIETSLTRDGRVLSVSAAVIDQGPAENALRLLAGIKTSGDKPAVDLAALAAAPEQPATAADASASASDALYQGLRYIRAGLYGEASRVLNEALTREGIGLDNRLELLLLAGLTDSNLGYFDSAQNRFDQAEALLRANPDIAGGAVIDRKRLSYVALDELNRQDLTGALSSLDKLTVVSDNTHPLLDPAVLVEINQSRRASRRAVDSLASAPDANKQNAYSQLVIDAQANWARSFVLLAQGRHDDALAALATSDHDIGVLLDEGVSPAQILWLQARIERQRARLLLVKNDTAGALAAIDRAVTDFRRAQVNGEVGPVLAEVEFDRAAILARDPARRSEAMDQFGAAVEELVSSDVQGLTPPPSVADYLNLLIDDAKANPAGDAAQRYFRAMQVVADPAIARQFVELQSLVSASPALAAKKQQEQDLEREVTRLRFEVADGTANDPAKKQALDAAKAKLLDLQGELQQDQAYGAVNDSAAAVSDVQAALLPGEAYFKLTKVHDSLFAILIDGKGAAIWRVGVPGALVDDLANKLHASIIGTDSKLLGFEVGRAYTLFQVLAGKQADRLLAAKALVVDSAGPLQRIPLGVLVATKASVTAYQASAKTAPADYSQVDFLVKHMPVSVALSPRSLIVARKLAPSAAPLPFIGFAQHQPAPETLEGAGMLVSVGSNCQVSREAIAKFNRYMKPISGEELDRAAQALGLPSVPELKGAAFTDTAVMARTDLNQFQVLHFATHGLTESPYFDYFRAKTDTWSCSTAPPALLTTLGTGQSTGILSFDKIARLKLDANLVVLSACDTAAGVSIGQARAAGQEEAGASLEGLVRAFLAANARAVLSTYWAIPVNSQDLMAQFYRGARGGTIGESLREAQVTELSNPATSHPFFWGAFFVVGDSNKPLLSGQARTHVAMNAAPPRP